jgi:hypothetical protein
LPEQATTTFVTYSYARRGKKVRFATRFTRQHDLSSALGDCQLVSVLGLNANLNAKPVPIWAESATSNEIASRELLFFHHALQGMLVLAREVHHLRHFRLGDLVGEHAAFADAVMVHVKHDLGRGFHILLKELL